MNSNRLCWSIVSALALVAASAHAEPSLVAKQLSGPPEEFATMRAPEPGAAAIHSKSALLPITLVAEKSGQYSWQGEVPVENGRLRFLVFSGGADSWQVDMASPRGGQAKAARAISRDVRRAQFGTENETFPAEYYALDEVESGTWSLEIHAKASSPHEGFLLIEGDADTQLASYQTHARQLVGERIGIAAVLTGVDAQDLVVSGKAAGRLDSATLRVTTPGGAIENYAMFDDGRHGDGAARDGVFGGEFPALASGQYQAQVIVRGVNANGHAIVRTAEHVIPVVEPTLQLTSDKAAGAPIQGTRLSIDIPVAMSKSTQRYRAFAEVWGTDAKGRAVAVAWVGGMVEPAAGALSLGFDQRWVAKAAAKAPFELRNLRIEDADYFVSVAKAERLALDLPETQIKASRRVVVDDEMTMGPKPADLVSAKGVGTRLLLVHGYCSGGVWPASQFSNASTFLDANQNRTHDQFARLIQSFGSTWNSFGTVSHSQGGAASLHLYTYYWSGLDNATGSRLMQSVGTPYQGTNIAGILAALGSWFGVGCGTNSNLTYSGSASWLAGIPTWARAKVNYYTTSFRLTNWWTNDYCNFATDLVLSDPEDGTTEQAYGQLPSAVNRGHTTGQCHTSGMRDPAQYNDSSRNWTMNVNAAR